MRYVTSTPVRFNTWGVEVVLNICVRGVTPRRFGPKGVGGEEVGGGGGEGGRWWTEWTGARDRQRHRLVLLLLLLPLRLLLMLAAAIDSTWPC